MPKCPKCGQDIDSLKAYSLEENLQIVTLEQGILDWGVSEPIEGTCTQIVFECPRCGAVLFENKGDSNDSDVIAFLKS